MTMQFLYEELVDVEARVKTLDTRIRQLCRQNENCQRILKIPGVGELTATAMVAAVSDPGQFRNGRHMSAWLGLVPRQSSSGDKQTLLGISKRGDRYLRTLLIHGARSVLSNYKDRDNAYNRWIGRKKATLSHNKAEHILLPSHGSQLRRSLEIWFQKKNINPFIVAEFEDRALMKAFGEGGSGIFTSPSAVEQDVLQKYGVEIIGKTDDISERFYLISAQRHINNPARSLINKTARNSLFS